jgi:hypothetical protein
MSKLAVVDGVSASSTPSAQGETSTAKQQLIIAKRLRRETQQPAVRAVEGTALGCKRLSPRTNASGATRSEASDYSLTRVC